jgi:flagellar basal body-associated protein FliL
MAEPDTTEPAAETPPADQAGADAPTGGARAKLLQVVLPLGVILAAAAAGLLVNRLGATGPSPRQAAGDTAPTPQPKEQNYEYYEFGEVLVNLNDPRLSRIIAVNLMLAIGKDDYDAAVAAIKENTPALKNWLLIYLADRSLDEVRGASNLNHILRDVQEAFNRRLWPDGRPLIARVEFKRWVVQ